MDEIQSKYRKRKYISFGLMACMVIIVVIFRILSPIDVHKATHYNLLKIVIMIGAIFTARRVFRCPNCNDALITAFYSSWGKLCNCPKCGVKLK
jgi:predicted RNA-binding Zn-ribbon protein involved in translation (DUF1610 family)